MERWCRSEERRLQSIRPGRRYILPDCKARWKKTGVDVLLGGLLLGLVFFFCWFEIGRFGIFGSSVDWISQHSVIPEYFRQQFYDTGKLFLEFAMGLGGGQNIYNFSYYGLYSPLLLPSYLLPSVRMGDYLMAVSMLSVAAAAVIFYGWQRSQGKMRGICFFTSLMLSLSGPMIFQSARQVMFVNYMPFLCMALWGVDRYLRRGKMGVYLSGVFLMIMTSFYYSIGGMLVVVIYGLHRYLLQREHPETIPAGTVFFSEKKWDAVRFLLPMFLAVLLSAFFLVPTAAALVGKRSGSTGIDVVQLFLPEFSLFRHLYSSYGVGLTTFLITALLSGLLRREWSSRVLVWSSLAVMVCPIFMWLLNGGLYVREKALIPFLPLFCYMIACYCVQVEWEAAKVSGNGLGPGKIGEESRNRFERGKIGKVRKSRFEMEKSGKAHRNRLATGKFGRSILSASLPYAATFLLLYHESGFSVIDFLEGIGQLPDKLQSGSYLAQADRWRLVMLDALLMLVWYFLYRMIWRISGRRENSRRNKGRRESSRRNKGRRKNSGMLLVLPVLFLALFGTSFRDALHIESWEFYEQVNQKDIGKTIERVLALDDGFFRMEQMGSSAQQAANINRVWNARQYSSSIYSSSYNRAYQDFRMNTFDVEEPAGNFMMQRSSANPVFQRLMGVRYLVKVWENQEMAADKRNSPFGYEWYLQEGCVTVYKNQNTAPICYATDRLITEDVYETLEFPYNQIVLEQYAVKRDEGEELTRTIAAKEQHGESEIKELQSEAAETEQRQYKAAGTEQRQYGATERKKIEAVRLTLPELETENGRIEKTKTGYRIQAEKNWKLEAELDGTGDTEGEKPKSSRTERTEERNLRLSKAEDTVYQKSKDTEKILYLQFQVKNQKPGKSMSIWVDGIQNTLSSSASGYFYYNHNTTFTYAVPLKDARKEVSVTLGKGSYEITDLRAFVADSDAECGLYQSEFIPDWSKTQGNRISGRIDVQSAGYFVTSIPYDKGFEVRVDGKICPIETVNTAFLGFPIEEGEHDVEIIYHAPGAAAGRILSLIGLMILVLWCLREKMYKCVLQQKYKRGRYGKFVSS